MPVVSNLSKNCFEGSAENWCKKCQPLFSLIKPNRDGGRGGKTRLFNFHSNLVYFAKRSWSTSNKPRTPVGTEGNQARSPS